METFKLSFTSPSTEKFKEFLRFKYYQAGSYISEDNVFEETNGEQTVFNITLPAIDGYMLGYDWALWQFPPKTANQ